MGIILTVERIVGGDIVVTTPKKKTKIWLVGGDIEEYDISGVIDETWMKSNGFLSPSSAWLKNITKIEFGGNLTEIGSYALYNSGVSDVVIPSNIEKIGEGAFQGCSGLKTLTIPSSVTEIGSYSLYGSGIDTIYVDSEDRKDEVKTMAIAAGAEDTIDVLLIGEVPPPKPLPYFEYDSTGKITGIKGTIPESIVDPYATEIADGLFDSNEDIVEISLPNVTTIGDSAFFGCSNLRSIEIPQAKTIKPYAFYDCGSLESLDLPSVNYVGESSFTKCPSLKTVKMDNLGFPSGVWHTEVNNAFVNCPNLELVDLSDNPWLVSSQERGIRTNFGIVASAEVRFAEITESKNPLFVYSSRSIIRTNSISIDMSDVEEGYASSIGPSWWSSLSPGRIYGITFKNVLHISTQTFDHNAQAIHGNLRFENAVMIDESAFSGNQTLARVYLPKVTIIGDSAFSGINKNDVLRPGPEKDVMEIYLDSLEELDVSVFKSSTLSKLSLKSVKTFKSSSASANLNVDVLDLTGNRNFSEANRTELQELLESIKLTATTILLDS